VSPLRTEVPQLRKRRRASGTLMANCARRKPLEQLVAEQARSSTLLMGQLPRQGNPPQSEWGSLEKSPKAASAGGLL
jgi:hypothetical protein